jgi:protein-S-isoprenylcysteine O-methyltransferase Ste14
MSVAALGGFAAFLVAAFGVRTIIHYRRVGRSGWLSSPTPMARAGDGLFTLGVNAGLTGSVLDLWGILEPLPFVDHLAVNASGAAVLAAGAVFALVAQAQMGRSWRAGIDLSHDHELITRGLFGIVRHPFYAGSIAASAGVFLMVPNLVTLAGWAAVLVGCEIDARLVEEPLLHATRGDAYTDYAERVPRFVPHVGGLFSR